MKHLFYLAASILPFIGFSKEVKVNSTINSVTVFMQGAQLFRTATISLEPGEQDLVFGGLTTALDPSSVRFGGKGNLTVLSVSNRTNYAEVPEKDENILAFEAQIKTLQLDIEDLQLLISVNQQEEDLLLKNKQLAGTQTGLDVSQLKLAADFLSARLTEIKKETLANNRKIKEKGEEIKKLKNQISQLGGQRGKTTREVVVKVVVKAKTNASFTMNYFVNAAGWTPFYDVRMVGLEKPIEVDYKAKVFQQTGEDWQDVDLVLSSGNPNKNATLPTLIPWTVDFYTNSASNSNVRGGRSNQNIQYVDGVEVQNAPQKDKALYTDADEVAEVEVKNAGASMTKHVTNFEYKVSLPYTIQSSNQPQDVTIQTLEIPAEFEYRANVKYDLTAYLVAKLHNWQAYNLLAGNAKLFNENTFVSDIFLDVSSTTDTLVLSLGRDDNIVIEREKIKDKTNLKTMGSHKKKTTYWEISVRNNKTDSINLVLTDQIPVSLQKDIDVKLESHEGAIIKESKGYLIWHLGLAKGNTRKVNYGFFIKYPNDMKITYTD